MMRKFYPCLSCGTTEKSIQTFFCGRCEESLMPKVQSKLVNEKLMMDRETEKQRAISYLFDGLTDEQSEAVAGEIISMSQEESFKLIEEMYEKKIWEK